MKIDKHKDNTYHLESNLRIDFKTIIAVSLLFLCILSIGFIIGTMYVNHKYQKNYEFLMFEMQKNTTGDSKCIQYKQLIKKLDANAGLRDSTGFREYLR